MVREIRHARVAIARSATKQWYERPFSHGAASSTEARRRDRKEKCVCPTLGEVVLTSAPACGCTCGFPSWQRKAGTMDHSPCDVESGLRALIARGYQFVHPSDATGEVLAVVGVRVHGDVVDVFRLDAEDDATAI